MLAFGLLSPIIFGFVISLLIVSDINIYERFALAYGLGFGLLTLAMFFLNLLGIKFSLINTTIFISGIIIASLTYLRKKNRLRSFSYKELNLFKKMRQAIASLYLFEKIILVLLIFFLLSNAVIAVYWPVWWWDALSLYDFRGKVFAEIQFIPEVALKVASPGYVFSCPPLTSLAHAWLYLCNWTNPKIFYTLLFVSLTIIFYYSLRDYAPRYHCFLFTLLLVITPLYTFSTHAYPNFPFAYYFSVATLYLYRWMSRQKRGFLTLSGVFLGLSSWTRRESPIFFLGYLAILLFFCIPRKRFFAPLLFSILYLSIQLLWPIYRSYLTSILYFRSSNIITSGISSSLWGNLTMANKFFDFLRWKKVITFFWKYIFQKYRNISYLLILTILLYIDKIFKYRFLFLLVVSSIVLFIVGIYGLSLIFGGWYGGSGRDAGQRLSIMFLPIVWYFIGLMTAEYKFLAKNSVKKRI